MSDVLDILARLRFAVDNKTLVDTKKDLTSINKTVEEFLKLSKKEQDELRKQLSIVDALKLKEVELLNARNKANSPEALKRYNAELLRTRQQLNNIDNAGTPKATKQLPTPQARDKAVVSNIGGEVAGGLGIPLTAGAGLLAVGAAVVGVGVKAFEATAKYQKFQAVLSNTLGKEVGREAFQEIKQFAKETPFELEEVTGAYIKLVNRGFKPTQEQMRNLGDIAASQGKSLDQLAEAVLDAQTGEFERLKEFGIRASKSGDQVSLSFKGVTKTVQNSDEAIQKAIVEFGKLGGVAGSMQAVTRTLGGAFTNLGDSIDQLFANIGNQSSGLFKELIDGASEVVGVLNEWTEVPLSETLRQEQAEINGLVQGIVSVNDNNELRNSLMAELNSKYPEFLGNIDAENVSNGVLLGTLRAVNEKYEERIKLQLQSEAQQLIQKEQAATLVEQSKATASLGLALKTNLKLDIDLTDVEKLKQTIDGLTNDQLQKIDVEGLGLNFGKDLFAKAGQSKLGQFFGSNNDLKNFLKEYVSDIEEGQKKQKEFIQKNTILNNLSQKEAQLTKEKQAQNLKDAKEQLENFLSIPVEEQTLKVKQKIDELRAYITARERDALNKDKTDGKSGTISPAKPKPKPTKPPEPISFQKDIDKVDEDIRKSKVQSDKDSIQGIEERLKLEKELELKGYKDKYDEAQKDGKLNQKARNEYNQLLLKVNEKYNLLELNDIKDFNSKKAELLKSIGEQLLKQQESLNDKNLKLIKDSLSRERETIKSERKKQLEQIQEDFEKQSKILDEFETKLGPQKENESEATKKNRQGLTEVRTALATQREDSIRSVELNSQNASLDLADKYTKKALDKLEEQLNKEELSIERSYAKRILTATESYKKGILNEEQYQKELERINNEKTSVLDDARIKALEEEQALIQRILATYTSLKLIGAPTPITDAQAKDLKAKSDKNETDITTLKTGKTKKEGDTTTKEEEERKKKIDEGLQLTKQGLQDTFSGISDVLEAELDRVDALIQKQTERVEKYRELADKGQAEQYQREVERLDALEQERDKIRKKQETAQKAQIIANQALAISNGIVAISSAAAIPFPFNVIAIAATVAGLASGLFAAKSQLSAIGKYAKGTRYLKDDRFPDGVDTVPIFANKGERIIPTEENKRNSWLYDKIQDDPSFVEDVKQRFSVKQPINYKKTAQIINQAQEIRANVHLSSDFKELKDEMKQTRSQLKEVLIEIRNKPVPSLNLDRNGLIKIIETSNNQTTIKQKL